MADDLSRAGIEDDASRYADRDTVLHSIAISLKRIADALHREPGAGLPTFLDQLHGVLSDASHDHAQRMS